MTALANLTLSNVFEALSQYHNSIDNKNDKNNCKVVFGLTIVLTFPFLLKQMYFLDCGWNRRTISGSSTGSGRGSSESSKSSNSESTNLQVSFTSSTVRKNRKNH